MKKKLISLICFTILITFLYNKSIFVPSLPKLIKRSQIINHLCNIDIVLFNNTIALNAVKNNLAKNFKSYSACQNLTQMPVVVENLIYDNSSETLTQKRIHMLMTVIFIKTVKVLINRWYLWIR